MAHSSRKVAENQTSLKMMEVLRDVPKPYSSGTRNSSNRCVPRDVHGGPNTDTRAESLYHDDVTSYGALESTDEASRTSGHNSLPVDHFKPSPAEEALLEMGIPTDIVHIAVQVIKGRYQGNIPENRTELYNLALDMNDKPSLKKKHAQEVKEMQARQQSRGSRKREGLSDLEEDGCPSFPTALPCKPNDVPSPSSRDAIPEGKFASSFLLPEPSLKGSVPAERKMKDTQPNPEAKNAPENRLQEKMQLHMSEAIHASEDVSAVKAELKDKLRKLETENRKLQHRKLCRMCRKVALSVNGVTFLPCGHFITCEACSEKLDDCPACRKSIMGTVRTFLA